MGGACEQVFELKKFLVILPQNQLYDTFAGIITSMQVLFITSMQVLSIHVHRSAWLARISLLELSLKSIIGNSAVSQSVMFVSVPIDFVFVYVFIL